MWISSKGVALYFFGNNESQEEIPIIKVGRTDLNLNLNLTGTCESVLLYASFASGHQKSFDGGRSTRAVMGTWLFQRITRIG